MNLNPLTKLLGGLFLLEAPLCQGRWRGRFRRLDATLDRPLVSSMSEWKALSLSITVLTYSFFPIETTCLSKDLGVISSPSLHTSRSTVKNYIYIRLYMGCNHRFPKLSFCSWRLQWFSSSVNQYRANQVARSPMWSSHEVESWM